jgi:hypothetical protein
MKKKIAIGLGLLLNLGLGHPASAQEPGYPFCVTSIGSRPMASSDAASGSRCFIEDDDNSTLVWGVIGESFDVAEIEAPETNNDALGADDGAGTNIIYFIVPYRWTQNPVVQNTSGGAFANGRTFRPPVISEPALRPARPVGTVVQPPERPAPPSRPIGTVGQPQGRPAPPPSRPVETVVQPQARPVPPYRAIHR